MASSKNNPSTDTLTQSPVVQAVQACLNRYVAPGAQIVVALSGGMDSLALLHIVKALSAQLKLALSAIHIHHGLSPQADEWTVFCEAQCSAMEVPLRIERIAVPKDSGEGIEGSARRLRYERFATLRCDWILLGHHRNDQAETVLLNLLRGAGVRGAAGMPVLRDRYLRPLLVVGREQIVEYVLANRLSWIEDESNQDHYYTRNFLRHEVLPLLNTRFLAAEHSLASAASHFAEAQLLLDELAVHDLQGRPEQFPLEIECLRHLSEGRARNVLRYLFAAHDIQVPGSQRMEELLRQMLSAAPDRHPVIDFGAVRVVRRKNKICLE